MRKNILYPKSSFLFFTLLFTLLVIPANAVATENQTDTTDNVYSKTFNHLKEHAKKEVDQMQQSNRIVAHRGVSFDYPQNTIPAFQQAKGYWGIETDIYPTTDGHWVCSHDEDISSYTNSYGKIMDMSLAELQKNKINNKYYTDLTFPTLEDFLKICVENKTVPIIEIKNWNNTNELQSLISIIKQFNLENKAIISSFHEDALGEIRKNSSIEVMLLSKKSSPQSIETAKNLAPAAIGINSNQLNSEYIQAAHQANLPVFAWTPTKWLNILYAKALDVDGVITNRALDPKLETLFFNW